MEEFPDMSHLTPEERQIIESVMKREKQEEAQQKAIMQQKQDEVQVLEETIRARSEKHKKEGVELSATCHVCLKTKFADGVGHLCNYCNIRCCARCGGKVTLRSNKVVWVCILCRKKQELLLKTGEWMMKTRLGSVDNSMLMQEDMQGIGPQGLVDQSLDKRPKLERAHSEKENMSLLQQSTLRRQYSQQEQMPPHRMQSCDAEMEMSVSPHSRTLPTPHVVVDSYPMQQTPRHPAVYPEDDPRLYQGEIDGLMKKHPQTYPRQRSLYQEQNPELRSYDQSINVGDVAVSPHLGIHSSPQQQHVLHAQQSTLHPSQTSLQQQRSFSSSEEERSTPECVSDEPDESEKGKGYYRQRHPGSAMSGSEPRQNGHHRAAVSGIGIEYNGLHPPLEELRRAENSVVGRSYPRNTAASAEEEWRFDSRRFTEKRGKKTVRFDGGTNVGGLEDWEADRQGSQDSATKDSGIETCSNFTSSEDSNRGDLPKHPLTWQPSRDGRKLIRHMVLRKSSCSGSSSSIFGLKVVGGKLLEDGSRGALIEKVKQGSTADVEGQLRPGDEVLKWNGRSLQGKSFREVSDVIAESRQESQVELVVSRKWSCSPGMMSSTSSIPTTASIQQPRRFSNPSQWRQSSLATQHPHHKGLKKCILWELYDARREKPSVLVTSPGSPDLYAQGRRKSGHIRLTDKQEHACNIGGSIQIKLGYDHLSLQLIVTILCASGLTPRHNGQPRNPYAKIFLLPDRSENSKNRTESLANTNDPRWNQTFVYDGIRRSQLLKRALEISVWDYRYQANDFLGEVILELASCPLNDEPEWHLLLAHGEHQFEGRYPDPDEMITTSLDFHLSPPTASRLSDSDNSECDNTDCDFTREQRRTADGASISSIGSSSRFHNMPSNYKRHYSSPPPEGEHYLDGEHRSRRDISPQGRKRAALMISRDHPASLSSYHHHAYRRDEFHKGMLAHRSHSAAPMDSSSIRYRERSQSPNGHRSLSPPEHRSIQFSSHSYISNKFVSRSATATPTGSPKKRQLPQIPVERGRFMANRSSRQSRMFYNSTNTGLSDSDLPSMAHDSISLSHNTVQRLHRSRRSRYSPDTITADHGDSDMESIASVTSSAFSTQSERPHGTRGLIDYASQSSSYEKPLRHQVTDNGHDDHSKRAQFTRSLSNADVPPGEKVDGSLSDTAVSLCVENASRRGRKSSPGSKSGSGSSSGGGSAVPYQSNLSKKSNSTSQLSATESVIGGIVAVGGAGISGIGSGFGGGGSGSGGLSLSNRKRNSTPSSIQRSEEIVPYQRIDPGKQQQSGSAASETAGSLNSISSSEGSSWSTSMRIPGEPQQLKDFFEDLGPAQMVGRQALGSQCLGEIQLSLKNVEGNLEVEVIRAKGLKAKDDCKVIPAPFVKLYLVVGKKVKAKAKTSTSSRKTLDPMYQQSLTFKENYQGCILQVTVWGDYGRLGKKVFMGIAQIVLDELNLKMNDLVIGWYKLFANTYLTLTASAN
ncbi:regulating synaptic membrane exocytosis protein 2 isoform X2 [Prorops nasuta]|uniref:regulating synaptic membrane exocytosis protein 2 isoform X2 n=1 Tax=Prorops nasuta TaxID=863751 RepID=UPI0034CD0E19